MRQRRRAGRQIVPSAADPPGTPMTHRARITGLLARWRRPALITDCDLVPGLVPRGSPSMSCVFTATSPRTSGTELLVLARFLEGWVHPSKNLACAGRRAGSARRYEAQTRQL